MKITRRRWRHLTRDQCDKVFYRAMQYAGFSKALAWTFYSGVRLAAGWWPWWRNRRARMPKRKDRKVRTILLATCGLFAGCANFQPIVDQATAQTVAIEHGKYQTAELIMCRAISIGEWMSQWGHILKSAGMAGVVRWKLRFHLFR